MPSKFIVPCPRRDVLVDIVTSLSLSTLCPRSLPRVHVVRSLAIEGRIYLMQHIQLSRVCGTLRVKHKDDAVSITLDGRPTALVLGRATRVLKFGARSLWGPDSHIASFKASAPTSPEVLYCKIMQAHLPAKVPKQTNFH